MRLSDLYFTTLSNGTLCANIGGIVVLRFTDGLYAVGDFRPERFIWYPRIGPGSFDAMSAQAVLIELLKPQDHQTNEPEHQS